MLSARSLDFSSPYTALNCWRVVEIENNIVLNLAVAICPNQYWADMICQLLNENTEPTFSVLKPGEPI